jgi:hypothetical protein
VHSTTGLAVYRRRAQGGKAGRSQAHSTIEATVRQCAGKNLTSS